MNAASDEQEVYQSQADRRAKQQYRRRVAIGQITVIVIVIAACIWVAAGCSIRSTSAARSALRRSWSMILAIHASGTTCG
jgi:hypothetical protein